MASCLSRVLKRSSTLPRPSGELAVWLDRQPNLFWSNPLIVNDFCVYFESSGLPLASFLIQSTQSILPSADRLWIATFDRQ